MVGVERTLKRAKAVVIQTEADYLLALTRQEGMTYKVKPDEARILGYQISAEVKRVHEDPGYDEEEYLLGNYLSKKKKK